MCRSDPTGGDYEIVVLDHTAGSFYDLGFVICYYLDAFPVVDFIGAPIKNYSTSAWMGRGIGRRK